MSGSRRSPSELKTLDSELKANGTREVFQAVAIKEVLAWQIEQAMKALAPINQDASAARHRRRNASGGSP